MAININTILDWFKTGKKPTQQQFWSSWQSFWHKDETIPQSNIDGLITVLNAKTENDLFNAHKIDGDAHAALFGSKENKSDKGVAGGYVPLNEISKIASQYLTIINDLITGGSDAILSAEQGVVLQNQINAINTILSSNDVDLDTIQKIVDTIKEVETSLETILVNDLTTGGTTKALTAEMGKNLKALIDVLVVNKTNSGGFTGTSQQLKNEIDSIYQPNVLIRSVPPTRSGDTFTYPSGEYEYLINKTHYINSASFSVTIPATSTSEHKRTDLIYGKPDNTIAKLEGIESTTVAVRPEAPTGCVAISFINVFGSIASDPAPVTQEISIQDSLGSEKFKVKDYLRVKGASFNIGAKQIEIDPTLPLSAFLDTVNGNDSTATLGNINKAFKTLEKLVQALPVTTGETYTIYMMSSTVNVLRQLPIRNLNWVSYTGTTLDFTNCMNADGVTHSTDVLQNIGGAERTWNFINSNISLKCTYVGKKTFTRGGVEDSGLLILGNINVLDWQSPGGASYNGVFCPRMGSDFIINTMFDSPQANTAFYASGTSKYTRIRIKTLNVNYVRSLTRVFVGDFIIENLVQVGNSAQSWTMHQGLTSNVNQIFKTLNFNGTITPIVSQLTFDNAVISSTCSISLINTTNITGNVLSSTTYIQNTYAQQNHYFKNFTGKLSSIQIVIGGTVTFENCSIEVNDWLVSRETTSTLVKCLFFKGINTINRVNATATGLFRAHQSNGPQLVMPIDCTISGNLKTNSATYGKDVTAIYSDATFKEKANEIVVRSKTDLINKVLSSTTTYIVDGVLTLLAGEYIQVPAAGLTITGYGFDVSQINKNVAGQSIFTSPAGNSGNLVTRDIQYNSGLGSVFNITDSDGTHALELNDVNFLNCSTIGTFNGYRQFTGTTCGIYGCSNGFILKGNWSGFKFTNSNVTSFLSGGTLIKRDTDTLFSNRLYLDLNFSCNTGAILSDFGPSNFASDELFQINNTLASYGGSKDAATNTPILLPNITPNDPKARFTNCLGIALSATKFQDLKSPNGNVWRVAVDNSGNIATSNI
ncbi:hypothetical protein [uncultured Flavobacterium sp.]|uniref:hypothetical protein n=1 Tax=uncultured Flavobacterium sp. TaxID=165435 RepID=UPI003081285C